MTKRPDRPGNRGGVAIVGLVAVGWVAWIIGDLPPRERTSAWLLFGAVAVVCLIPGAIYTRWATAHGTTRFKLSVAWVLAFGGVGVIIGTQEPLVKVVIGGALAGFLLGVAIFWPRPR